MNNLFSPLNNYLFNAPNEIPNIETMKNIFNDTVKIDLGKFYNDAKDGLTIENPKKYQNLPFSNTLFSIQSIDFQRIHYGWFYESNNTVRGAILSPCEWEDKFKNITKGWAPFLFFDKPNNSDEYIFSLNDDEIIEHTEYLDYEKTDLLCLFILFQEGVKILNCSNIILKENKAGKFINKKRKAKNKPPLFTYKTLHINTEERTVTKGHRKGTHASPRVHLRRGHIRKLSSGKTIWVQSCIVGDKEKGVVVKDYSLEQPTTIHTQYSMNTIH